MAPDEWAARAPYAVAGAGGTQAWLRHAHVAKQVVDTHYHYDDPVQTLCKLTEENVVAQLDHLRTHPAVAARLVGGQLGLHGWVYDIEAGTIKAYCSRRRHFVPLEEVMADSAAWPSATPPARLHNSVEGLQ